MCVCVRKNKVNALEKISFGLSFFNISTSPQACCFTLFFFPPPSAGCAIHPSKRTLHFLLLCTEKLTCKNFYQWTPCTGWGQPLGGPGDRREGRNKVRSGIHTPDCLLRSHLGAWVSLSKGQAVNTTAPLCVTLSPWAPGRATSSLGPGLVLTLSQGAALTLVASSQLSQQTLY